MIILSIILAVSTGLLFWFNRQLIEEKTNIEQDLIELHSVVNEFGEHLERVYGMDLYYGDPTIKNLIRHTSETRDNIKDFCEIYFDYEENDDDVEKEESD